MIVSMKREKQEIDLTRVYDLLYRLGVNASYAGFFHTAYAVHLAMEDPRRMLLVTKWLYPEVARCYGTNWRAVERNIRSTVRTAWRTNPELLREIAHGRLFSRPTPTQFIAILAAYLAAEAKDGQ